MRLPLPLLWVIVLAMLFSTIVDFVSAANDRDASVKRYVYSICNDARQSVAWASEQACGYAQDRTGTEFLCAANNQLPDTKCWVEVK